MKSKKSLFLTAIAFILVMSLALFGCGGNTETPSEEPGKDDPGQTVPEVVAPTIELSEDFVWLDILDKDYLITATVKNTDESVVWTSKDPAIATVDGGRISAVAEGTTVVTAKAGGAEASCTVVVQDSHVTPVIRFREKQVDVGKDGGTASVTAHVVWKGKELTGEQIKSVAWALKEGEPADLVTISGENTLTATFTGGAKSGTTVYEVTITAEGADEPLTAEIPVVVHNLSIVFKAAAGGALNLNSDGTMSASLSMLSGSNTLDLATALEVYTVSDDGTQSKVSAPEYTVTAGDESGALQIEGTVITAVKHTETTGPALLNVQYEDSDVLTIKVTAVRPDTVLEQIDGKTVTIETGRTEPLVLTLSEYFETAIEGAVTGASYNGLDVFKEAGDGTVSLDPTKFSKKNDSLGVGKTLSLDTDKAHYTFTAEVVTLAIKDENDFANIQDLMIAAGDELHFGGYFILANDITCSEEFAFTSPRFCYDYTTAHSITWDYWLNGESIGFTGTFDGRGHKIDNYHNSNSLHGTGSLFHNLAPSAEIMNVAFTNIRLGMGSTLLNLSGSGYVHDCYFRVKSQEHRTSGDGNGIMYNRGMDRGARIERVFIEDFLGPELAGSTSWGLAYTVQANSMNGVYAVMGNTTNGVFDATSAGNKYGIYENYSRLMGDSRVSFEGWDESSNGFWKITEGGIAYPACLTVPEDDTQEVTLTEYITADMELDVPLGEHDVFSFDALDKDGMSISTVSIKYEGKSRAVITIDESVETSTQIKYSIRNVYKATPVGGEKTATVLTATEVNAEEISLGDIDYSDAGADETANIGELLGDKLGESDISLDNYNYREFSVNGVIFEGVTYDEGSKTLTFPADAKNHKDVFGEKTAVITFKNKSADELLRIKVGVVLASVIINNNDDIKPGYLQTVLQHAEKPTIKGTANVDYPNSLLNAGGGLKDAYSGWIVLNANLILPNIGLGTGDGCTAGLNRRECFVNGGFDGRGFVLQGNVTAEIGGNKEGFWGFDGLFPVTENCTFKNVALYDGLVMPVGSGYGGGSGVLTSFSNNCTFENCAGLGAFRNQHSAVANGSAAMLVGGVGMDGITMHNCFGVVSTFNSWNNDWAGYSGILIGNTFGHPIDVRDCIAINLKSGDNASTNPGVDTNCVIPAIGNSNERAKVFSALGMDATNRGAMWLLDPNGGSDTVHTFHGWQDYIDWGKTHAEDIDRIFASDMVFDMSHSYDGVKIPALDQILNYTWDGNGMATSVDAWDPFSGIVEVAKSGQTIVGTNVSPSRWMGSSRYYYVNEIVNSDGAEAKLTRTDEYPTLEKHSIGNNVIYTGDKSGSFTVQSKSLLGGKDGPVHKVILVEEIVDATGTSLTDVDYSDGEGTQSGDFKTTVSGKTGKYNLDELTFKYFAVDGTTFEGVTYDKGSGSMSFPAASKTHKNIFGEKTADTFWTTADGGAVDIRIDIVLCSAILTSADHLKPDYLHSVLQPATKMTVTGSDTPDDLRAWGVGNAYSGWLIMGADIDTSGLPETKNQTAGLLIREGFVNSGFDGRGHILGGVHTCTATYYGDEAPKHDQVVGPDAGFDGVFPLSENSTFKNVVLYESIVTWVGGGHGSGSGILTSYSNNCTFENIAGFGYYANSHGTKAHGTNSLIVDTVGPQGITMKNCFGVVTSRNTLSDGWCGYGGILVGNAWGHKVNIENSIGINLMVGDSYAHGSNAVLPTVGNSEGASGAVAAGLDDPGSRLYLADPNGGSETTHTFHGWEAYLAWGKDNAEAIRTIFASDMWDLSTTYNYNGTDVAIPVPARLSAKDNTLWTAYKDAFDCFSDMATEATANTVLKGKNATGGGRGNGRGTGRYYWMPVLTGDNTSGAALLHTDEFPKPEAHSIGHGAINVGDKAGSFTVKCVSLLGGADGAAHTVTVTAE